MPSSRMQAGGGPGAGRGVGRWPGVGLWAVVAWGWLGLVAMAARADGPAIRDIKVSPTRVLTYERVVVRCSLGRSYDNPFDPKQIELWAELEGPGGTRLRVPGFWLQPYEPADEFTAEHIFTSPGLERYRRAGEGWWEVRVALPAAGTWRGQLVARDAGGKSVSRPFTVRCRAGPGHGFVRPAPNGQFLCFDDGTGFVPVGLCIAWARGRTAKDTYDYYLPRLARAGGNTVRIWMCHWAWLEWTRGSKGALQGYLGVGRYNQQVAYNFDRIIELAERTGIWVQLCLNNACWEFGRPDGKHWEYDSWGGNPYNADNGGPCKRPGDFWSSPQARALYRNKLRYIVARWGYSTHILAWELWNEAGAESDPSASWHAEMGEYLRRIDPYRHMVTTSSWVDDVAELRRTWQAMDLLQLHYTTPAAMEKARRMFPRKPLIIGEGPWKPEAMVRAACARPLQGAAGPPLTWHSGPDSPVERHDMYGFINAMARTWANFPAAAEEVRPVRPARISAVASDGRRYAPVIVYPGFNTWLKRAPQSRFVIGHSGRVDTSGMSGRLYGSNPDRAPYRNPPCFIVDYPTDGWFAVRVGECSGPSVLVISIDGAEALRYVVPGEGRRHPPENERWQKVRVPAGRHTIVVDNAGHDWMTLGTVVLANYRDITRYPPVTALGLRAGGEARLWVANEWAHAVEGLGIGEAPALDVTLYFGGLEGSWRAEWYRFGSGSVAGTGGVGGARGADGVEVRRSKGGTTIRIRALRDHVYGVLSSERGVGEEGK